MVQCCTDTSSISHLPSRNSSDSPERYLLVLFKDESFVSKTLNKGHVELSRFPASKVRQMAKKFESSKATAKHMKKVTGDPEAVQVNLLRHQSTELPPSKFQRKQNKRYRARQAQTSIIRKINTKKECLSQ